MTIKKDVKIDKTTGSSRANCNKDDNLGLKMYMVLCLQRGHLVEALETAKKLQKLEPKHKVLQELIR